MRRVLPFFSASAITLAGALFCLRLLASAFGPDTETLDHPAIALSIIMVIAGLAYMALVPILRAGSSLPRAALPIILVLGLALRVLFFGSSPVYENDYKRYLWDGAVTAQGVNPYEYSPTVITKAGEPGASSLPELATLAIMSNRNDNYTSQINSPDLTTIYPPAAQLVFTAAYYIAPFKLWGLKLVFLAAELLGLWALLLGLRARRVPLSWSALYWLNPVIIFTTYNMLHMDILLVAPLLAAVLWAGRSPLKTALMLSLAAAIKLWPLLLAPIFFRHWRNKPTLYIGMAVLIAVLTLLSILPMLLSLNESAGLTAYSTNWTNSSFLFPGVRDFLSLFLEDANRGARLVIATFLTLMSLWFGIISPRNLETVPLHLLLLSATFIFLSPTGYPWYFIWFFMFLPFCLQHWSTRGLALLTVGAAAYFVRYLIGESGRYELYTNILLPIEFGIPLLILLWDWLRARRYA